MVMLPLLVGVHVVVVVGGVFGVVVGVVIVTRK